MPINQNWSNVPGGYASMDNDLQMDMSHIIGSNYMLLAEPFWTFDQTRWQCFYNRDSQNSGNIFNLSSNADTVSMSTSYNGEYGAFELRGNTYVPVLYTQTQGGRFFWYVNFNKNGVGWATNHKMKMSIGIKHYMEDSGSWMTFNHPSCYVYFDGSVDDYLHACTNFGGPQGGNPSILETFTSNLYPVPGNSVYCELNIEVKSYGNQVVYTMYEHGNGSQKPRSNGPYQVVHTSTTVGSGGSSGRQVPATLRPFMYTQHADDVTTGSGGGSNMTVYTFGYARRDF